MQEKHNNQEVRTRCLGRHPRIYFLDKHLTITLHCSMQENRNYFYVTKKTRCTGWNSPCYGLLPLPQALQQ